jgi:hypothetical protein
VRSELGWSEHLYGPVLLLGRGTDLFYSLDGMKPSGNFFPKWSFAY